MREGALIAGKYRLQHLMGEGAAGEVWAARNARTERDVAIKLILGADQELHERALREARALGRVSHRSVIEVLDAGETERGEPYLVMPLLSGETVGDRLRREGRIAPAKAAAIALEVARGLVAAHAAGIIHRDLKPNNIFLHRDAETGMDQVKVLDFGVSKMLRGDGPPTTRNGDIVGSPAYMSPEQARADRLDQRTDLWSLGVVLFEMLAGRRPFPNRNIAVISDIVSAPIPAIAELLPGLDPRLAFAVGRCLTREVHLRVQSAQELAALLRPCAGNEDVWGGADSGRHTGVEGWPQPGASAPLEEDLIATMHVSRPPSPLPSFASAPPVQAATLQAQAQAQGGFRPVPMTLLDRSRSSELWRQQAAAARVEPAGAGYAPAPAGYAQAGAGYAQASAGYAPPPAPARAAEVDMDDEASTAEMRRSPVGGLSPAQPSFAPGAAGLAQQQPAAQRDLAAPRGRRVGLLIAVGATSVLTLLVLVLIAIGLGQRLGGGGRDGGAVAPPPAGAEKAR